MKSEEAYQLELEFEQLIEKEKYDRWTSTDEDKALSLDPAYEKWTNELDELLKKEKPF